MKDTLNLTQAVTYVLFSGCIGTRVHCRQVALMLSQSDVIVILHLSVSNSGTSGSVSQNKEYNGEQEKECIICVNVG